MPRRGAALLFRRLASTSLQQGTPFATKASSVLQVAKFAPRRAKPISLPIVLGSTYELDDCAHGSLQRRTERSPSRPRDGTRRSPLAQPPRACGAYHRLLPLRACTRLHLNRSRRAASREEGGAVRGRGRVRVRAVGLSDQRGRRAPARRSRGSRPSRPRRHHALLLRHDGSSILLYYYTIRYYTTLLLFSTTLLCSMVVCALNRAMLFSSGMTVRGAACLPPKCTQGRTHRQAHCEVCLTPLAPVSPPTRLPPASHIPVSHSPPTRLPPASHPAATRLPPGCHAPSSPPTQRPGGACSSAGNHVEPDGGTEGGRPRRRSLHGVRRHTRVPDGVRTGLRWRGRHTLAT